MATTSSTIAVNIQGYYDRLLLDNNYALTTFDKFGDAKKLPDGQGTRVTWRRYNKIAPSTVALTESVTPSAIDLGTTEITATVDAYGQLVVLSDVIQTNGLDPIVNETVKLLSESHAQTYDLVIRDAVVPNIANRIYIAADLASTTATDVATVESFRKAALALKKNNARPFTPMIEATDKVGTTAIKPSFWSVVSPEVKYDLETQNGYVSAENYASTKTLMDGEVGAIVSAGIRLCETTNGYIDVDAGNLGTDVYFTPVFARGAYGFVKTGKMNSKTIIKPLGSSGVSDGLNQRSSVGYKFQSCAKVLDDSACVVICSASSQGNNA